MALVLWILFSLPFCCDSEDWTIFLSPGVIVKGENFSITCEMASLNQTGKLYLLKSVKENSSAVQSKYLKGASATFLFTNADFADEGNYSCWQNSSSSFHSQESLPIELQIKDPLPTPFISVSSHTGDIAHGQSFHINCSIETTYSFGTFKLLQTAGNMTTRPLSKETLNQSVTFSFLRTDFLNEGNYTCVYETTISGRNISSPESRSISVTVTGLRLANGGRCAGRVEVFYKGTWGTVCDNAWGLQNADVVCQQKGYGAAVSAPHNAAFGLGSGDILQDDVRCFGNEMAFSQCPFRGWRLHNCDHSKDASVICQGADFIQKPQISLTSVYNYFMPGEVFHIVCSMDFPLYTLVDFYLYHNEGQSERETAAVHKTKVNFTRSRAASNHEGNYSCRFQVQGTHLRFDSPFSDSIYINIVDLKKPNISIGHQDSKHIKGQSLDIICSTISKYPGGKFHLLKLTKFNFTNLQSVVSFNHSAVFSLPKTAIFHEGNYLCQYEVEVSGRSFVSPLSDPVNITGSESSLIITVCSAVGGGILFFLIIILAVLKRRKKKEVEKHLFTIARSNNVMNLYVSQQIQKSDGDTSEEPIYSNTTFSSSEKRNCSSGYNKELLYGSIASEDNNEDEYMVSDCIYENLHR